ncbi:MAG: SCO family protein [Pseudomonadota bacterium]
MLRWLFLALALVLAGCDSKPQFANTDITGADYASDFALTDHTGKPRTMADYRGKVVVMFFGYTQCPDVCPTTMMSMAQVMQQLGEDAKRVQVLFVTLDPERDTKELLAQYVPAFHPDFVGLYGDAATTARTAQAFRVFYQKQPGSSPTNYTIDHAAGTYVFDTLGKLRLYVRHGEKPEAVAADIKQLLKAD